MFKNYVSWDLRQAFFYYIIAISRGKTFAHWRKKGHMTCRVNIYIGVKAILTET